ncbi:MAG: hypothetical protein ACRDNR_10920 [Gaiellaceae bacterium]
MTRRRPFLVQALCAGLEGLQREGCVTARWLGRVHAVVTNGEFEELGCPTAPSEPARRAGLEGARATGGPLETFC